MKKFFRVVMFIMAFQMEVRVRASSEAVLEQPKACLKAQAVCALQVTSAGFHLVKEDLKIHAAPQSALIRFSPEEWRLVQGALWMEEASGTKVETLYGTAEAKFGQYWLIEKGPRVIVRNISADLKVTLKDGKVLSVPEGFEFWMGGINSKGQSDFGMIQPIALNEHLVLWNSLYRGSKESFVKEVKQLRETWGDLAERGSQIYQAAIDRGIASENAKKMEESRRKAAQEAKIQEMKRLYREKVFER